MAIRRALHFVFVAIQLVSLAGDCRSILGKKMIHSMTGYAVQTRDLGRVALHHRTS